MAASSVFATKPSCRKNQYAAESETAQQHNTPIDTDNAELIMPWPRSPASQAYRTWVRVGKPEKPRGDLLYSSKVRRAVTTRKSSGYTNGMRIRIAKSDFGRLHVRPVTPL